VRLSCSPVCQETQACVQDTDPCTSYSLPRRQRMSGRRLCSNSQLHPFTPCQPGRRPVHFLPQVARGQPAQQLCSERQLAVGHGGRRGRGRVRRGQRRWGRRRVRGRGRRARLRAAAAGQAAVRPLLVRPGLRCTPRLQRRGTVPHADPCSALEGRRGTAVLAGVAAASLAGAPGTPACRARTPGLRTAPRSSAPAPTALGVSGACCRLRPSAASARPAAGMRLSACRCAKDAPALLRLPPSATSVQARPRARASTALSCRALCSFHFLSRAHDPRPARAGGRSAATARPTSRARRPTCPPRSSSAASSGAWAARRAPSRTAWACCRRAPAGAGPAGATQGLPAGPTGAARRPATGRAAGGRSWTLAARARGLPGRSAAGRLLRGQVIDLSLKQHPHSARAPRDSGGRAAHARRPMQYRTLITV